MELITSGPRRCGTGRTATVPTRGGCARAPAHRRDSPLHVASRWLQVPFANRSILGLQDRLIHFLRIEMPSLTLIRRFLERSWRTAPLSGVCKEKILRGSLRVVLLSPWIEPPRRREADGICFLGGRLNRLSLFLRKYALRRRARVFTPGRRMKMAAAWVRGPDDRSFAEGGSREDSARALCQMPPHMWAEVEMPPPHEACAECPPVSARRQRD
mmetsp:Transcript_6089/g.9203  ORF Transcript_6089/g.9203 Transcript_6089/m.9203 type:complete len:214 (-) Transcript_6089:16-657(-)